MQSTIQKPAEITRSWYVIDAAGKPLGHTAAAAAHLLRGKHKVDFTPHVDGGDYVIIINAEKAVLTGKKLEQKFHYRHSGYLGGLKSVRYDRLMKENPDKAVMYAVKGMLPKNSLGSKALTRCRIYRGAEHENQAQNPQVWQG